MTVDLFGEHFGSRTSEAFVDKEGDESGSMEFVMLSEPEHTAGLYGSLSTASRPVRKAVHLTGAKAVEPVLNLGVHERF